MPVTRNPLSKPEDLMLQNATPLRKSAPSPPNSSDENETSCTAPATENASLQTLFKCPTPAIVFGNVTNPHVLLTFEKVHNPLRLPCETSSERPKVVRTWCALYILTSKCASRHNGVQFFDIATSKSAPKLRCFVHFDFGMCFAPQRRALFSTSQLPKVVRPWCVLYILTWKCASRHNGVHFSVSHLARWLRTRRFSEPTFRPSGATSHWKNTVFGDFPTFFAHLRLLSFDSFSSLIFSLLTSTLLFSLTLSISAFHLSILSEV